MKQSFPSFSFAFLWKPFLAHNGWWDGTNASDYGPCVDFSNVSGDLFSQSMPFVGNWISGQMLAVIGVH